jgi:thiol-disulfide isomerase/thioredoxin
MNPINRRWAMVLAMAVTFLFPFPPIAGSQPAEGEVLVGPLSRQKVKELVTRWGDTDADGASWKAAIGKLRAVAPGARVEVFLGTWCDDSRREIPRLMKVLDEMGGREPFEVAFVGVDRDKRQPAAQVETRQVQDLPTIVVTRSGQEVGRIVAHPARTLETDLLRLLDGSAHGLLSSNEQVILRYFQKSGELPGT